MLQTKKSNVPVRCINFVLIYLFSELTTSDRSFTHRPTPRMMRPMGDQSSMSDLQLQQALGNPLLHTAPKTEAGLYRSQGKQNLCKPMILMTKTFKNCQKNNLSVKNLDVHRTMACLIVSRKLYRCCTPSMYLYIFLFLFLRELTL